MVKHNSLLQNDLYVNNGSRKVVGNIFHIDLPQSYRVKCFCLFIDTISHRLLLAHVYTGGVVQGLGICETHKQLSLYSIIYDIVFSKLLVQSLTAAKHQ